MAQSMSPGGKEEDGDPRHWHLHHHPNNKTKAPKLRCGQTRRQGLNILELVCGHESYLCVKNTPCKVDFCNIGEDDKTGIRRYT